MNAPIQPEQGFRKLQIFSWGNIFLLLLALQYAFLLGQTMKTAYRKTFCEICPADHLFYIEATSLLYLPVIYFLLYRKKRTGWVLILVHNLTIVSLRLLQMWYHPDFLEGNGTTTQYILYSVSPKLAVAIFVLWPVSIRKFSIHKLLIVLVIVATLVITCWLAGLIPSVV